MYKLAAAHKDQELTADTTEVYRDLLKDLSPEEWGFAVKRCLMTKKWFPKISELLDAVREMKPSAAEMWAWLNKAAETGKKPEMDAATAAGLEAIGGWSYLCYTDVQKLSFSFKIFEDAFRRAQDGLGGGAVPAIEHRPLAISLCTCETGDCLLHLERAPGQLEEK